MMLLLNLMVPVAFAMCSAVAICVQLLSLLVLLMFRAGDPAVCWSVMGVTLPVSVLCAYLCVRRLAARLWPLSDIAVLGNILIACGSAWMLCKLPGFIEQFVVTANFEHGAYVGPGGVLNPWAIALWLSGGVLAVSGETAA